MNVEIFLQRKINLFENQPIYALYKWADRFNRSGPNNIDHVYGHARHQQNPHFMNPTQIAIEQLAGVVMIADADPQSSSQALGRGIANLLPLLEEYPQSARLALGLQNLAEEIATSPESMDVLADGIALLQRLYANNERGSTQVDDPSLYDRIVELVSQEVEEVTSPPDPQREEDAAAALLEGDSEIDIRAIDPYAFGYFTEEAKEHIAAAEVIWLSLEAQPEDTSQIDTLFRAYHTLKGAASYANLTEVIELTHVVETILDNVRSGRVEMQAAISELGIESIDLLRSLIESVHSALQGEAYSRPQTTPFKQRLEKLSLELLQPQSPEAELESNDEPDVELDSAKNGEEKRDTDQEEAPTSPTRQSIGVIQRGFEELNINDLSTLGVLSGDLEVLADDLRDETPRTALLATAMGQILEKLILEECAVEEAMDLLALGCPMLDTLRYGFETNGKETIEDATTFEQILALGEIRDIDLDVHSSSAATDLTPEAMLIADDALAGAGADAQFLEEAPPQAQESIHEPVELMEIEVDSDIFADFSSEADEHLHNAENALLLLESNPEDDELLNTIFRAFHTIKGAAGFLNLTDVTQLSHAVEDVLDSARKKQLVLNQAITDVVLESVDLLKELLEHVEQQLPSGSIMPRDVSAFVAKVTSVVTNKEVPVQPASTSSAAGMAETPPTDAPDKAAQTSKNKDQHVRVGTDKLDSLVNVVGELVIAQTQVSQNPDVVSTENQKLTKDISQLMKISTDLQEIAMSMRMVPIRSTFDRMARMVRDLARKCDKQVEFSMSGEDTELDKNVIEEILDPLTHMVRNAVDHGVEHSVDRLASGKSEKGHISLHAYHKGGNFVIELRDDGNGINRDRVLQKAIERGLVGENDDLSDEEIYDLVFHPGLSTAEKVSDVSGRGVGMDVVRRNIETLRGKVEVQSTPGKGSTFTIRLPLTLAIIDGMVIGVGSERYILPLTSIISSLRPATEQICTVMGKGEMVKVLDELYPLLRLHERFDVTPRYTNPWEGLVMLIEAEGERTCLLVDELLGLQQVVIKGLDEELRQDPCLSGCAILGDGCIGLILDANGLVAHSRENSPVHS